MTLKNGFGKCSLFVSSANRWKIKISYGLFFFAPKETLIWRRHCSIGQSCCSMTSKRSIFWFLDSSREWSFFTRAFTLPAKSHLRFCHICSINQWNCSISFRLLFLFCLRVFISRSYENRFILRKYVKHNLHLDWINFYWKALHQNDK